MMTSHQNKNNQDRYCTTVVFFFEFYTHDDIVYSKCINYYNLVNTDPSTIRRYTVVPSD